MVEATMNIRLDDLKTGGEVEISWRVKRMMADVKDLASAERAVEASRGAGLDRGKDRVFDRFERVRDQRRAYRARGVSRAERDHAASKVFGDRRARDQVPREVHDVSEVVALAEAVDCAVADRAALVKGQPDRPADARRSSVKGGHARAAHPLHDIRLDEQMIGRQQAAGAEVSYVQRGV